MTDEARVGLGGPGQRTTERVGGHDAEVEQPRELTWDRMKRRAAEAVFALIGVPLLVGPWVLVVYIPLYMERAAYAAADWFDLRLEDGVDRVSTGIFGALAGIALALLPDAAMGWWPFWWQRSAESLRGLLWPMWWPGAVPVVLLLRAAVLAVALAAWPEVWYLDQRQRQGTMIPTFDSLTYTQQEPGAVKIPGVFNPYRLPEAPPQVTVQPTRPVPFNAPKASLVLDVLMTPSGKTIGADDVLDMLEAQPAAGLSWRTWHARNWSRSDWEAALEILEAQGLVTPRQSGRTTQLTVSPDAAMDAIERLV